MRFSGMVLLFVGLAGCDMPRDPEGTFRRVQGGTLRAGITAHQPWTTLHDDEPAGIEVELLEQFAEHIGAEIEWTRGAESELLEKLERGSLDVMIGGLKEATPWSKKVALTQPFITLQQDAHVMAVRQGENRWLLELDAFLQRRRDVAMQLYRESKP